MFRWEDMGLHEATEMLIYRSLIPEKKGNAELQVSLYADYHCDADDNDYADDN